MNDEIIKARTRVRASVDGVVQGVGFRPFVHRLAREHELAGWVRNDACGVVLEVEGEQAALERFLAQLAERAPPLAVVERVRRQPLAATGEREFRILTSAGPVVNGASATRRAGGGESVSAALVSPDIAPCEACVAELMDPRDCRYRYPFINCTDCGPRFTIIRAVPYDRARTTMAGFEMCAACRAEYEDPASRRFHAQPNACPACGPTARLIDPGGRDLAPGEDAVAAAAAALLDGGIVAVKGAGGYHLACRADDEGAVAELRRRKRREEKPFALMAPDVHALCELVELSDAELELVVGRERPIVIARRRAGARVAAAVAPDLPDLGVMLASTPLHHLLLGDVGTALVMTSGNVSDEPIAFEDKDALMRLGPLADALLVHDRSIHVRADDSMLRSVGTIALGACAGAGAQPLMLRRARGYVPRGVALPLASLPLLACGAELKSTFCLAVGGRAWVGHHIGDLKSWETLRSYREGIAHFEALFALEPRVVVHDLHPDYLSSRYALEREGVQLMGVQHHHAHFAAVLAEHGELGRAVAAVYDGAGLGTDGAVWGGELLAGDVGRVERVGHLQPVRLPGGDAATRQPWRMACSWLVAAHEGEAPLAAGIAGRVEQDRWDQVADMARRGVGSPLTTSVGRLFDAVAALCGIRMSVHEEGRAAAELEAAAQVGEHGSYPLPLVDADVVRLDARETVRAVVGDLDAGASPALVSARFHNGLADATVHALALLAQREGVHTAVLCGGVFQNRLLLERCVAGLHEHGLRALIPRELPPNDGAISYGQAAVAATRLSRPMRAARAG
jgi:hydrogenase maturation protein HypF